MPEVMGSMLEFDIAGSHCYRLYLTGDTLVIDDLKDIPSRYSDIDLALLHLGGTRVLGILVTMDAKQGVEMVRLVRPHVAIPIHYNDYDVFKSSLSDFQREVAEAGLHDRIRYLGHGDTYTFQAPSNRAVA